MANKFDITAGSLEAILLTYGPNWKNGIRVQHSRPSRVATAETGKERRRPRSKSTLHAIAYEIVTLVDDAEELRNLLGNLAATDKIAIPFWPDAWPAAEYEANRRYDPQYVVNFDEGEGATIYAADSIPGTPDYSRIAPLLIGKIEGEPSFRAIGEDKAQVALTIQEDSPYTHRIDPVDQTLGANWPVDLIPNWASSITEISRNGFRKILVGELRERQTDGDESVTRWERSASFQLVGSDIGEMIDFFHQRGGRSEAFEAPAWFAPGSATSEAPFGFKSRFMSDVLDVQYINQTTAEASVSLVTLPWESVSSASFEDVQRILLFEFTYQTPTPYIWRFTNHEAALTNSDGTWTPAPFELTSKATRDLSLTARTWSLKSHVFVGNPLAIWHPYGPEAPMSIKVTEADIDSLDSGTIIRYGRVQDVEQESRELKADCTFFGKFLDRPFPSFRIQHKCNWKLFSAKCGLSAAAFEKSGTIDSITGNTVVVDTAATNAANYFAGGYVQAGDGLTFERRKILSSSYASSQQTLVLDRPFRVTSVSDAVTFLPGCDKRGSTCRTKFGSSNYTNFGGCEWIRETNPSIQQPESIEGGKK